MNWHSRPSCNYRSDAVLYLNHSREYRMVDVDKAVRKALAEGKTEISWYIGGDRQEIIISLRRGHLHKA